MSEHFLGSYKGFEILAKSGQYPLALATAICTMQTTVATTLEKTLVLLLLREICF
jgi:hypothetical protein